jgi:K+-transporting ATPase ATPase B chain
MAEKSKRISIWDAKIIRRAAGDSFRKLDPRALMRNPVMFVVEVGSVLATLQLVRGIVSPVRGATDTLFELQITLRLWFTVLFANFAEAMAEGRCAASGRGRRARES